MSSSPLHRIVLVRKNAVTIKGPQPLERNGCWSGVVSAVIDGVLKIKIHCGTARQDILISLPIESDKWRLRFP